MNQAPTGAVTPYPDSHILRFGPFAFDAANSRLCRDGVEVHLTPKAAAVLQHLLRRPGELITKDEFLETVWGGVHVREESLTQAVSVIRSAIGDSSQRPRWIETVSGAGYRFVGEVSPNGDSGRLPAPVVARRELPDGSSSVTEGFEETHTLGRSGGRRGVAIAALAAGIALGWLLSGWLADPIPVQDATVAAPPSIVSAVVLAADAPVAFGSAPMGFDSNLLTLSPDGRWLVYVAAGERGPVLYRHRTDTFGVPELVPNTEGALHAFFDPSDSTRVGFLTDSHLKWVSLVDDETKVVASAGGAIRGFWTLDGWIYLAPNQVGTWRRLRWDSGQVEDLPRSPTGRHLLTDVHPDGRWALYGTWGPGISGDQGAVRVFDLDSGEVVQTIQDAYDGRWLSDELVLFGRGGSLFFVRVDPENGSTDSMQPARLLRRVAMDSLFGSAQVAVSASGVLAFVPGGERAAGRISVVERGGEARPLPGIGRRVYGELDLAPDDRSLAAHVADVADHLWIYDFDRAEGAKLPGSDNGGFPRWKTGSVLSWAALDADGAEGRVVTSSIDGTDSSSEPIGEVGRITPSDWSLEGGTLALTDLLAGRFGFLTAEHPGHVDWIERSGTQVRPHFSPDGRWIVYQSDETGRYEIWIESYPDGIVRRQLSVAGGYEPIWCRCGEIIYRRANRWVARRVTLEPVPSWGPSEAAFSVDGFIDTPGRSYDVSSDGRLLYTVLAEPRGTSTIHLVNNWFERVEPGTETRR